MPGIGVERPAIGTFVNLGSPLVTEVCAMAGFDWLLVDLEHGAGGEEALVGQTLAAAAHDVPLFVRVESAERIRVGRVLDLGVAGVMIPRIEDASEAQPGGPLGALSARTASGVWRRTTARAGSERGRRPSRRPTTT